MEQRAQTRRWQGAQKRCYTSFCGGFCAEWVDLHAYLQDKQLKQQTHKGCFGLFCEGFWAQIQQLSIRQGVGIWSYLAEGAEPADVLRFLVAVNLPNFIVMMKFGVRTTERERNSTSCAVTEKGNASQFSFFCQVIAFKMSSYCNTVILSIVISFVIYCCWVKRWLKRLVKISDLQLALLRTQLLSLRKFKGVLYDLFYLQLWSKCIRGLGSTSLKWSAFGLFCAIVLGCCTILVEQVLLPNSGFDCQVQVKAVELCWKLWLEMAQPKCQDPVCWCRGSEPDLKVAVMVGSALPGECP